MRIYTVRNHLEFAERALKNGAHADKARLDSEQLLMHLLRKNRAWLIAHPTKELSAEQQNQYEALVERRLAGEPIQYITGECEFYGLPFKLTRDVLIPRPETEHLVEKVSELVPLFSQPRIVDVGTGSGAIAIALAHDWSPPAIFTAIDVSEPALDLARWNAERIGFADRLRFLQGDLLEPVVGEQFDIIASNPPYVPNTDRALIAVEVREYEPALALFAGEDGLDVYRRLIPAAFAVLVPGGFLALEIGFSQADSVKNLLAEAGFADVEFMADLQGIPRVASAMRP